MDKFMDQDRDGDTENFFTDEEERILEKIFVNAFISCNPNPNRHGCPDPKLIRDVAFHRIRDKEQFIDLMDHLIKCSPCSREARILALEYKERKLCQ